MWSYCASSCINVRSYITVIITSFPLKDLLKCSKQKMRADMCCLESQRRFAKINEPGAHKNLYSHSSQIESSVHWFQKALSKQNTYWSLKQTSGQIWWYNTSLIMLVSESKNKNKTITKKTTNVSTIQANTKLFSFLYFSLPKFFSDCMETMHFTKIILTMMC